MLIKVEPAGFLMFTVQFCFDTQQPDAEDGEVREYLTEHNLEPRYQWDEEVDGRQCQWLQFGGCYLGNHLNEIGQIQRRAVEVELLTEEIAGYLDSKEVDVTQRESVLQSLLEEFHLESSFGVAEDGGLAVFLERSDLDEALKKLLPA